MGLAENINELFSDLVTIGEDEKIYIYVYKNLFRFNFL